MTCRFELFVSDLERSVAFYRDVLGFEVGRRSSDQVMVTQGEVVIGLSLHSRRARLHYFSRSVASGAAGLGVELVLEVDDVAGFRRGVLARGATLEQDLKEAAWGQVDFRLIDPDGYYLRITSRPA